MIEKGLIAFLKADTAITAIVGTRIYPTPPQNDPYPRITIKRIDTVTAKHLGGATNLRWPRIQVDCWALGAGGYGTVKNLANLIRKSQGGLAGRPLDGFAGVWTPFTVASCFVDDERDNTESPQDATENTVQNVSLDLIVHFYDL